MLFGVGTEVVETDFDAEETGFGGGVEFLLEGMVFVHSQRGGRIGERDGLKIF